MINVFVQTKDGKVFSEELPCEIYNLYEHLLSAGIDKLPTAVMLSDNADDDISVKLYSDSDFGNHLIPLFDEQNSLAEVNMLTQIITDLSYDIKCELEQNVLWDQYKNTQEIYRDISAMIDRSAPVKSVFYCPLVGELVDDESESSYLDGRQLNYYGSSIQDALEADMADDKTDMAKYFDRNEEINNKLVTAKWGIEEYRGRLFGKIECGLREELTDREKDILTEWITGQNSDGYGEHFEQQPISTDDGKLYVSFWNSSDDYTLMTHDELDEYINNKEQIMGGM